jgi:hypothetical protein
MAAVTPTPVFAPSGTYVPPPSHSVTHFTPAPSCSPEKLWLVSTQGCNVNGMNYFNGGFPSWAECALTLAGDPHPPYRNVDCYPWNLEADGTSVFISECPVGYTTVWESQGRDYPYDTSTITEGGTTSTAVRYKDIVAHSAVCCPDNNLGGFHYNWDSKPDYVDVTYATDPDGNPATISLYVPPRCVATSVCAAPPTVTMDVVFNSEVSDKKRRRQDAPRDNISPVGVVTRSWDADHNALFAHSVEFGYTVFHGTYTCFEDCYNYASYSYDNTDPNSPPSSVDEGPLYSTADYEPTRTRCSASPTGSGPSNTVTLSTPTVGGSAGWNASATRPGYSTIKGSGGHASGASEETATGAPSPIAVLAGAATKMSISSLWASFVVAIAALL